MSTKRKNPARTATKSPRKERIAVPKDISKARTPSPFTRDPRLPAVGTVIQRAYKAKVHEVTVREDGFEHEGETYRSLSALARKVTGFASINGFLFFGLAKPEKPSAPKPGKGSPEQVASVAKARAARAAKVAARKAAKASS
jgi:hypothetical protein